MRFKTEILTTVFLGATLFAQNSWQPFMRQSNNLVAAACPPHHAATPDPYQFPVLGAIDVWRFNMASGDLVSYVKNQTYSVTNATGTQWTYSVVGPNGLVGVTHDESNGGNFRLSSQVDTSFDIGALESYTLMFQFKANNSNHDSRIILDFGTAGANTNGIYVELADDRISVWTLGALGTNLSRTDAGIITNGVFYTIRVVMDRLSAAAVIYIKPEGGSETSVNVNKIFSDFSAIGDVQITTDPMAVTRGSNNSGSPFWGTIYQVAFAKGTTYDVTSKP